MEETTERPLQDLAEAVTEFVSEIPGYSEDYPPHALSLQSRQLMTEAAHDEEGELREVVERIASLLYIVAPTPVGMHLATSVLEEPGEIAMRVLWDLAPAADAAAQLERGDARGRRAVRRFAARWVERDEHAERYLLLYQFRAFLRERLDPDPWRQAFVDGGFEYEGDAPVTDESGYYEATVRANQTWRRQ